MKKNILTKILLVIPFILSLSLTGKIHAQEPPKKTLNVFLVGTGVVGGALLEQIDRNKQSLQEQYEVDIRIVGIANSRKMLFNNEGVSTNELEQSGKEMSWNSYLSYMFHSNLPHPVFVDCTSNQMIADAYLPILLSNISIVTPNKKANSREFEYFKLLKEICKKNGTKFFYDSNVGAGLPILSTVRGLIQSGDQIVKIEAVLSGTLSYLFNTFDSGTPFSKVVLDAQQKGYTEPDPRDDLNGMDFARKLLILSREAGLQTEMKDIELKRFLPDDCFEAPSIEEFYVKLRSYDDYFSQMAIQAELEGKRLRYIASFEEEKEIISLQAIGPEHPFYSLSGNDNIVALTTKYYSKNPIVIKGPGAGAEVTAARVLAGIVESGQ